jgi:hydroxymethylpyrimidine/phosphomethylpyrimidine kinase
MTFQFPAALTIAGSDPSGGAGIQMDLKTFAKTGVWGMAVITALTAQNAAQVTGSWPMDPEMVREQIITVLEDLTPGAIKTGMLANTEIIKAVEETVPKDVPLVIDPVMISTSGYRLLNDDAICDICERLIPLAHLITPNIPEAEIISQMKIASDEDVILAGSKIMDLGAKQVLIKGGHGKGDDAIDYLIMKEGNISFRHTRLPYDVHGSGCCLSAAITGYIAHGFDDISCCKKAKDLVTFGIRHAYEGKNKHKMINP